MSLETFLNGRVTLHAGDCLDCIKAIPDASIDSVVTDPPYALVSITKRFGKAGSAPVVVPEGKSGAYARASAGFMGKAWDVGDRAFAVEFWSEVYRVLKPGGHVLAFGGTRTVHRLTCAIEDAGFEIRDMAAWMYGSGFPKSHDVSKGIDKRRDDRAAVLAVTSTMADAADLWGITRADVDAQMGTSDMGGWWLSRLQHRCQCPRWDQWLKLKPLLNLNDELDAEVWRLNGRKGTPGQDWLEREVTGEVTEWTDRSNFALTSADGLRRDKASSAAARQWEGWGTALKPAMEPITLARKPLTGTVAENVLAHGTGALNIAGCRVGSDQRENGAASATSMQRKSRVEAGYRHDDGRGPGAPAAAVIGRWPANVILDGSEEVVAAFPDAPGQQRAVGPEHGVKASVNVFGDYGARDRFDPRGDTGSAARFFYSAKADSDDRIGSKHPTVKPVDLMRYLVRLVTPPGGVVLDPFAGTGTTGEAAYREGFSAVLIEREDEYRADIARRMGLVLAGPEQRRHAIIKAKAKPDDMTGTLFATPEAAE